MNYKKVLFACFFLLILIIPVSVNATTETKLMDLSKWENIAFGGSPAPNWKFNADKTSVTQSTNSRPAVLLSDIECTNNSVNGSFSVDTTSDDDFIGFVFGFRDSSHFYLFDWKQKNQNSSSLGYAKQGMSVKVINADSSLLPKELWSSAGNSKVKVLYQNSVTYKDKTVYDFSLNFTDQGTFTIVVKQGSTVLDSIKINDNSYTSGRFGFYNLSQEMVTYKGFTFEKLPSVLEVTSTENTNVDLSWTGAEDATSYNVKRSQTPGGPYETIASNIMATTYTDTDVTNGTTYYYVVSAVNTAGESGNSNEVSATPKNPTVTLEVTSVDKAKLGDEITANIVIHNAVNICAEDLKIAYDTSKLQFISAENADGNQIYKEDDIAAGIKRYITACLGKANAANGDKILLKLKFKAIDKGEAKIDITNGRIADNATLEMDVSQENCGEKTILIEGVKDVNRTGEYTLLDLGIDAWYYGDAVENTDTSKYDADQIINGTIDDDDLTEIVAQLLGNTNYSANK